MTSSRFCPVHGQLSNLQNLAIRKNNQYSECIWASIESALKRSADVDASRIRVEAQGDRVTLRGSLRSWVERDEAEHAAWSAQRSQCLANGFASAWGKADGMNQSRLVQQKHPNRRRRAAPSTVAHLCAQGKEFVAGFIAGASLARNRKGEKL